jgi:hypothetical protein
MNDEVMSDRVMNDEVMARGTAPGWPWLAAGLVGAGLPLRESTRLFMDFSYQRLFSAPSH